MKKTTLLLALLISGVINALAQCTDFGQPDPCVYSPCNRICNSNFDCAASLDFQTNCDFNGWVYRWANATGASSQLLYPRFSMLPNQYSNYMHLAALNVNSILNGSSEAGIYQHTIISSGKLYFLSLKYKVPETVYTNMSQGGVLSDDLDLFTINFSDNNSFPANCVSTAPPANQQLIESLQNLPSDDIDYTIFKCVKADNDYEALYLYIRQEASSLSQSNIILDDIFMFEADAGVNQTVNCNEMVNLGDGCNSIPGATYSWSPSIGLSSTNSLNTTLNASLLPSGIHNYTLTINYNGCSITDDVQIVVDGPSVYLGPNITGCLGQTYTVTATPGFITYNWSQPNPPNCTSSGNIMNACDAGTYCVTVNDGKGCTATDCMNVSYEHVQLVDLNYGPSIVCPGDPVTVSATVLAGSTYLWSTDATTTSIDVNPNVNTTYTVTVTSALGCTVVESIEVIVDDCTKDAFCKYFESLDYLDKGAAIEATADGGFVAVGTIHQGATDLDLIFLKFDSQYNLDYRIRIGDEALGSTVYEDISNDIVIANNSYYIIGSSKNTTTNNTDVLIAKVNGVTQSVDWCNRYGTGLNDVGTAGILYSGHTGSRLLVTGYTDAVSLNNKDILMMSVDLTNGNATSVNTYEIVSDAANLYGMDLIYLSASDDILIAARYNNGQDDILMMKVNPDLTMVSNILPWRTTGAGSEVPYGLEVINSRAYVVGKTSTWGSVAGNQDIYIIEMNPTSMVPTANRSFAINAGSADVAYKAQRTSDNRLTIVGDFTDAGTPPLKKAYLMYLNINPGGQGNLAPMWTMKNSNAQGSSFVDICEIGTDHLLLTGEYFWNSSSSDLFISLVDRLDPDKDDCCLNPENITMNAGLTRNILHMSDKSITWVPASHKKLGKAGKVETICEVIKMNTQRMAQEQDGKPSVEQEIAVFPNPASSSFSVKMKSMHSRVEAIVILDMQGRIIKSQNNIGSNQTTIDVSDIDDGIYTARIVTEDGKVYTSGLVITKVK